MSDEEEVDFDKIVKKQEQEEKKTSGV